MKMANSCASTERQVTLREEVHDAETRHLCLHTWARWAKRLLLYPSVPTSRRRSVTQPRSGFSAPASMAASTASSAISLHACMHARIYATSTSTQDQGRSPYKVQYATHREESILLD